MTCPGIFPHLTPFCCPPAAPIMAQLYPHIVITQLRLAPSLGCAPGEGTQQTPCSLGRRPSAPAGPGAGHVLRTRPLSGVPLTSLLPPNPPFPFQPSSESPATSSLQPPAPTCLSDELLGLALAEGADVAWPGRHRGRAQGLQAGGTAVHHQGGQLRGDLLGLGDGPHSAGGPRPQALSSFLPSPAHCPWRCSSAPHSPLASVPQPPCPLLPPPLPRPPPGRREFDRPRPEQLAASSPSPGPGPSAAVETNAGGLSPLAPESAGWSVIRPPRGERLAGGERPEMRHKDEWFLIEKIRRGSDLGGRA